MRERERERLIWFRGNDDPHNQNNQNQGSSGGGDDKFNKNWTTTDKGTSKAELEKIASKKGEEDE